MSQRASYLCWLIAGLGILIVLALSMSWSRLWLAVAAIVVLELATWFWPGAPRLALSLSTADVCERLPPGRSTWFQRGWLGLYRFTLIGLLIALAGPQGCAADQVTEGITLALVVDVSGSMATPDFVSDGKVLSRLEGVQDVFKLLVAGGTKDGLVFPGRPSDLIALVPFALRPETACPPTLDHAALLQILARQTPKTLVNEATTNPGDALAWALASLQKAPTRRKAIIFLTDGESNVPPPALSPRQAGQLAANLKIPIYAIDALNDAEVGEDAPKAHKTLEDLAEMTGGQHFRATDGPALLRAVHRLDQMERDAIARPDLRRADLTQPVAIFAFVGWLAYLAASLIVRWTP